MIIVGAVAGSFAAGVVASAVLFLVISQKQTGERTHWRISPSVRVLLCGVTVAAAIFIILHFSSILVRKTIPPVVSRSESFSRLGKNLPTKYFIRFVAYNPSTNPELAFAWSHKLGGGEQLYTFAASYDELLGYTVADAVSMVGLSDSGDHVSAVIFRNKGLRVFPANARGILQVVNMLQNRHGASPAGQLDLSHLSPEAKEQIDWRQNSERSYAFDAYNHSYKELCSLVDELSQSGDNYSVQSLIGSLGEDFNPLGFAKDQGVAGPDFDKIWGSECDVATWEEATAKWSPFFGARAFLIPNTKLSELADAYIIDFNDPSNQTIPLHCNRQRRYTFPTDDFLYACTRNATTTTSSFSFYSPAG